MQHCKAADCLGWAFPHTTWAVVCCCRSCHSCRLCHSLTVLLSTVWSLLSLHTHSQESHSSRLEKRKKEAAAAAAMQEEMAVATQQREAAAAAAAAADAEKRAKQGENFATPGVAPRRATTPRRPFGL